MVTRIKKPSQHQLLGVIEAADSLRFRFCLRQRGEQHARQDRDDSDHHEKLDKSEGLLSPRFSKRFVHEFNYLDTRSRAINRGVYSANMKPSTSQGIPPRRP